MRQRHDALAKLLFSMPQVVRDLLLGFVPCETLRCLDFSTLELMPSSFITKDLRHRAGDAVWRILVDGEWTYIYLLLEFQSTVDDSMAVRMAQYVSLLYEDLASKKQRGQFLPPVVPMVIYTGDRPWNARRDLSELVAPVAADLASFQLRLQYFVLDTGRCDPAAMAEMKNLVAYAIEIEHASAPEHAIDALQRIRGWIGDDPELRRVITRWTKGVLAQRSNGNLTADHADNLEELQMAISPGYQRWLDINSRESLERGRREGIEEGMELGRREAIQQALELGRREAIEEGMIRGRRETLCSQLTFRFGALPHDIEASIAEASAPVLDAWARQLLVAETLADVFRGPSSDVSPSSP